jgi:hypothetical protein
MQSLLLSSSGRSIKFTLGGSIMTNNRVSVTVRFGTKSRSFTSVREAVEALGGRYSQPEKVGVRQLAVTALRNDRVTSVAVDGVTYTR